MRKTAVRARGGVKTYDQLAREQNPDTPQQASQIVYARLPRQGKTGPDGEFIPGDALMGVPRHKLNELILGKDPEIASIVLRSKRTKTKTEKGVRLIIVSGHPRSLTAYLNRLKEEQCAA